MPILLEVGGLLQTVAGGALLIGCSAVALNASRVRPLAVRWAVPAVLASTAANAVTPAGLGGSALMARMHSRTGLSADEAVAAVSLRALASGVAGVLIAALAAATLGLAGPSLPGGSLGPILLVTLLVGGIAFGLACPHRRGRVAGHLRSTGAAVADVLTLSLIHI